MENIMTITGMMKAMDMSREQALRLTHRMVSCGDAVFDNEREEVKLTLRGQEFAHASLKNPDVRAIILEIVDMTPQDFAELDREMEQHLRDNSN